ncbi:MAG: co-chaperone GroES [Deltaproteobacteria bacterium]|nr:co-chaperone GroES [Deltaproteobacteria bacterium]
MSAYTKKKSNLPEVETEHTSLLRQLDTTSAKAGRESKTVRKINPLGMRVVVRVKKDGNQTEGGLYLPEGAKQAMAESLIAEVIEVASAIDDHTDEETNVSGIPLGALVLISKEIGVRVPWDDELRIVETKHILAIVNEIDIT